MLARLLLTPATVTKSARRTRRRVSARSSAAPCERFFIVRYATPFLVTLLAVTLSSISAAAEKAPAPPPAESGVIDSQSAIMLWPDDGKPLTGCEAHLMPLDHQDIEYRYGCGEWFLPPARGSYKMWAERADRITHIQTIFTYQGGSSPRGGTIVHLPLGPAGEIALSAPRSNGLSLHAANLDTYLAGTPVISQEFDRRTKANEVRNVRMPVGRILAGLFDVGTNEAVAVARPATLIEGRVLYVNPQPPAKGADVFAVLQRPRLRTTVKDDPVEVKLEYGGSSRPPDVMADDAGGIVAVWYAIPAGPAKLRADSDHLQFSREIVLREQRVTTVRGVIQKLPSVRVTVKSPIETLPEMHVSVLDGANRSIREAPVHDLGAKLEGVPAAAARVRLESAEFSVEQPLDLSSGADAEVIFTLSPFTVQGTLYRGEDRASGEIEFQARGKARLASAAEDGHYTVALWSPAYYLVRVRSPDIPQTTVRVHLFDHAEVFDIRLPGTRCTAVLRSKATGRPASGTKLVIMNKYTIEDGQEVTDREEAVSDSNGVATLPPLHPGSAEITVWAHKEFRQYQHTFSVLGTTQEQTFTVDLESADAQRKVTVRWPDGTPAAGVDLVLWNPQTPLAFLWRGSSDPAGEAALPAASGAFLLARHPRASAIARAPETDEPAEVRLTPATVPLFVKCVRIGASAVPVEIALWIDGVRLMGAAVAFMSGTGFATNGAWSATSLPTTADLRILAFHPRLEPAVLAGQYDALATRIAVPQSDTLSLRVVE